MPKGLCITWLVIATIIFVLFLLDLVAPLVALRWIAPFGGASLLMDISFVVCALILAFVSWTTLKEQG